MKWLETLLEPLLDRLALKLALKIRAQLDGAIDAALDRADDRIDKAFEGLEERLLAVASEAMEDVLKQVTGPIADMKEALAPVITVQQQVVDAEKYRAEVWSQAARIQQEAMAAAVKPGLALQQQIEALGPERVQAAAKEAGMIPAAVASAQITAAAQAAIADGKEQLRMRPFLVKDAATGLMRPRHIGERPDR